MWRALGKSHWFWLENKISREAAVDVGVRDAGALGGSSCPHQFSSQRPMPPASRSVSSSTVPPPDVFPCLPRFKVLQTTILFNSLTSPGSCVIFYR